LLSITALPDRVGLRLEGEADMSTQDQLRQALTELPTDASAVHLDLTGLRFIDVICTRELMSLVVRNPGRRVILHSPSETLQHMINLLWPGSNIEIATRSG
jgi:anti-anti-sigma factor